MKCKTCKSHCAWVGKEESEHGKCLVGYTPKTNADRIRAMTDEELDKFLGEVQWDTANYCGGVTQKQEYPVPEQRGAWLGWLRQEAEEGEWLTEEDFEEWVEKMKHLTGENE